MDLYHTKDANSKSNADIAGISGALLSQIESITQQTVSNDVVLKLSSFF